MRPFRFLTSKLALLVAVASLLAMESQAEDLRPLLEGFEWDAQQTQWQPASVPWLVGFASADREPLFLRRRAVAALATIDDKVANEALLGLIRTSVSPSIQRRAMDEVCQLVPQSSVARTEVVRVLLDVLESSDAMARFRAAKCLQRDAGEQYVAIALERYYLNASNWERKFLGREFGEEESGS